MEFLLSNINFMKERVLVLLACLFASFTLAMAQSRTVRGTVADEAGDPIIGASVLVKGTNTGTITDIDGAFVLSNVPSNASTLVISYVGMKTQEVAIANNVQVVMANDAEMLEEVVVTGYGSQRKASFTGAATVVGQEAISRKTDANFVKSLEGTVTGLTMSNSTSMPGTWASVNIRGLGSLSSNDQPLYVIDGMPVNSDSDTMSSSSNNSLDPMASINPNDIESVTVLKDAAATAIYGSRAANGVIVITTKKGAQGKLSLNLDVKQGFSSVANNNMKFANAKQTMDLFARGYMARYPDNFSSYDEAYNYLKNDYFEWDGVTDVNWPDQIFRNAHYQDYNLSIQGGSNDTHYYISGEYLDTKGVVVGSDMKRYSGRVNLDSKYKFLTVGMNASVSYTEKQSFSQSTNGSMSSPQVSAMSAWLPMYPTHRDGDYNTYDANYNPLAVTDPDLGDQYEVNNLTINMNPYLQIDFGYGIWAKSNLGVNVMDQREYNYWSAVYNNQGMKYNGLGQQYNSRYTTLTWNNTLGWNHTFNDVHNISILLGQETQKRTYYYEYYEGADFPFAKSGMRDMSTAGQMDMGAEYSKQERTLASFFADLHYDYANRYYVSGSIRRDGSSLFGANHRWGTFWSFGLKWRVSEEAFLKDNNTITNLAVRLSDGTVGNQDLPSWYAARGVYETGYNYNSAPGMVPSRISNPNLTWEKSNKFDVGIDVSLFHKLNFSVDYYNEVTSDALFEVPLSRTTGLSTTYQNIGKIRNRGLEFSANYAVVNNKDWTVNVFGTLTWNKNKVIKMNGEPIESTYTIIEEGYPYRQFKMVEYAGVDRETGLALYYKNETGDETTTNWNEASKRYVGSADPKVYGGFGANATWKGFDLSVNFTYKLGGKVYDSGAKFTGWGTAFRTPLEKVAENSWTPENKDAAYPQWVYGATQAWQNSTRWLMSGNFLRLSNITFGYTLPKKFTRKALMDKVRLYTTFDNVYTWTAKDFTGYNPETYASGEIAWQYPAIFTFTGGIQVTF